MIPTIVFVVHISIMVAAVWHALLCKRAHRTALAWIAVVVLFPVAGPVFYFLFGINRLRTRAKQLAGKRVTLIHLGEERGRSVGLAQPDVLVDSAPEPWLALIGGRATGAPLRADNEVRLLVNGDAFFPELIRAIDAAQSQILLVSYLFSGKGVAGQIVEALERAAARGVQTCVLIDGIGVHYSSGGVFKRLRRAGIEARLFIPPRLLPPSIAVNLRNHRKIALIDGTQCFFGGTNIHPCHLVSDTANPHPTEDLHFFAQGPIGEDLHRIFVSDWRMAGGTALTSPSLRPAGVGDALCRPIADGPDENLDYLTMTLIGIFSAARHSIDIHMPYFLPHRELLSALQGAILRGVKVRVVLPERSNLRVVDWATRKMLWELIVWDIEIYYKPKPFAHSKLILVDEHYALVGSANMDARSLRLNFELGVEMFGGKINAELRSHASSVLAASRLITLEELDQRPVWEKTRDAFFWLFSSYL